MPTIGEGLLSMGEAIGKKKKKLSDIADAIESADTFVSQYQDVVKPEAQENIERALESTKSDLKKGLVDPDDWQTDFNAKMKMINELTGAKEKKDFLFKLPPKELSTGSFLGIGGGPAYNQPTFDVMQNIKTKQDLEELIQNREDYEAEGVNIERILEFWAEEAK
jgi:hypothetical protein